MFALGFRYFTIIKILFQIYSLLDVGLFIFSPVDPLPTPTLVCHCIGHISNYERGINVLKILSKLHSALLSKYFALNPADG